MWRDEPDDLPAVPGYLHVCCVSAVCLLCVCCSDPPLNREQTINSQTRMNGRGRYPREFISSPSHSHVFMSHSVLDLLKCTASSQPVLSYPTIAPTPPPSLCRRVLS
ncbi:hypothetical protein ElyMa_003980000 [Elysia marginata]|uniref:Uncharacterized protein n=1 Tax=Elysia marginata TaxID=1093978 RepID=A0AAV4FZQ4_9GAST|nr:hypothetical protein ElyMa_003980000 [Elysia marginata]